MSDSYEVNEDVLLLMKREGITAKDIEKEKGHTRVTDEDDLRERWSPGFEELVRRLKPQDLRPKSYVLVEENPWSNLEKHFPHIFSRISEWEEQVDGEIKKFLDADADFGVLNKRSANAPIDLNIPNKRLRRSVSI